MSPRNRPRAGKVKMAFLQFVCKAFGRKTVFRLDDAVKAGWSGSKNINLAKLARDGYLRSVGKKRYRYLRGVKASDGRVIERNKPTKRTPITPETALAKYFGPKQIALPGIDLLAVKARLEEIRSEIKKLQGDETKLVEFLGALEKLPDIKGIISK